MKGIRILPVRENNIVVALDGFKNFKADETWHFVNKTRPSLEAFLKLFFVSLCYLYSVGNDNQDLPLPTFLISYGVA